MNDDDNDKKKKLMIFFRIFQNALVKIGESFMTMNILINSFDYVSLYFYFFIEIHF